MGGANRSKTAIPTDLSNNRFFMRNPYRQSKYRLNARLASLTADSPLHRPIDHAGYLLHQPISLCN
jgi:hypothetical protein